MTWLTLLATTKAFVVPPVNGACVIATDARRDLLSEIDIVLEGVYRSPRHGNYRDPTTELFYILLTVRTRIADVRPRLQALKRQCGNWNHVADATPSEIMPILAPLGFGSKRAKLIIQVADRIRKDRGRVDLSFLKRRTPEDAIAYLRSLPFVGEKVARCVAMYCLDADVSPMDTHATRVLSRTGVLPRNLEPKHAHAWIDRLVPTGASFRLHVNLVAHGQSCCKAILPVCKSCPLNNLCRYYRTGH